MLSLSREKLDVNILYLSVPLTNKFEEFRKENFSNLSSSMIS